MRNGAPFSKPRVRLYGKTGDAQQYLGAAYNLLYKVRRFCEASGVPVFAMQHTLDNGAVVQAAILGNEEIVSCFPPTHVGGESSRKDQLTLKKVIPAFFATPSSTSHTNGFTPQHPGHPDAEYPGPLSVWAEYPDYEEPPDAAPKDPESENAELAPSFTVDKQPGVITWFSDAINGEGSTVVVSWLAPNARHGRFMDRSNWKSAGVDSFSYASEYSQFGSAPGRQFLQNGLGRKSKVWIDGRPYDTGVSVWSAALRREQVGGEDVVRLYVFSALELYRCVVGRAPVGVEREPVELSMEFVGVVSGGYSFATQPLYFNASCTKAVGILEKLVGEGTAWASLASHLVEVSVPSLSSTSKKQSSHLGFVYSGTRKASFDETSNRTDNEGLEYETYVDKVFSHQTTESPIVNDRFEYVLAADYKGADLVYITATLERTFSDTYSATVNTSNHTWLRNKTVIPPLVPDQPNYEWSRYDGGGSGSQTVSSSSTASETWTLAITHSTNGVLFTEESVDSDAGFRINSSGSTIRTYIPFTVIGVEELSSGLHDLSYHEGPGGYGASTYDGSVAYTDETADEPRTLRMPSIILANADLRFDTYVVGGVFYKGNQRGNGGTASYSGPVNFSEKAISSGFISAKYVRIGVGQGAQRETEVRERATMSAEARVRVVLKGATFAVWSGAVGDELVFDNLVSSNTTPIESSGWAGAISRGISENLPVDTTVVNEGVLYGVSSGPTIPISHAVESTTDNPFYRLLPITNLLKFESAQFAFSPDGRYSYVCVETTNWRDAPDKKIHGFLIDGTFHPIPEEDYSPGNKSTLAGGIFLPNCLEDEDVLVVDVPTT